MKKCNRCLVEKERALFSPLRSGRDGLNPVCKSCRALAEKEKRESNPELARQKERARHAANPDVRKSAIRRYYETNAETRRAQGRENYAANAERIKEQKKLYRANNPEKIRFHNGTRRALVKAALPLWADKKAIAAIYRKASDIWASTGIEHHVDHIVPLKGKLVCGLHVPENLQILPKIENIKKGNRFEPAN